MRPLRNTSVNSHFYLTCNRKYQLKTAFFIVLVVCLLALPAQARYSGGTGEPNSPYRIGTPNDLNDIGNHVEDISKCFVMVNDINLAGYTSAQFNIIGSHFSTAFTGVFDGNGHTISNFGFQTIIDQPVGIFGWVFEPNAVIKNLHLAKPNIDCPNAWYVGSLVGSLADGTISGCTCSDGRVSGHRDVGGLLGMNWRGKIENCHVRAVVSGEGNCTGGLVGSNGGTISLSSSAGSVTGENFVGGLAGVCGIQQTGQRATIEDCHSTTDVAAQEVAAGGLVGSLAASVCGSVVQRCYATGCVDGNEIAGGLVALACDSNISNCYALGAVDANNWVGGLVGGIRDGLVEHCYAAGPVSGNTNVGALAGRSYDANSIFIKSFWDSGINPDVNGIGNAGDPNVIGNTAAEMQMETTFTDTGWDFVEVWGIGEGQTYPFLRTHSAGDLDHNDKVNFSDVAILCSHWLEEK